MVILQGFKSDLLRSIFGTIIEIEYMTFFIVESEISLQVFFVAPIQFFILALRDIITH